jgi:hypothetical protein
MLQYGDIMAKAGGPALAEWAYKTAEKLGCPPDKNKVKALEKPLEEFNKTLKALTTDAEKYGPEKTPKTEYEYRYKLPLNWSIENEWPVLFVFHSTGGGWGKTDDNEETQLKHWSSFADSGNWIVVSIREPSMIKGGYPAAYKVVEVMEEILSSMFIRYRANPNSVGLASGGSGALCCWPYLEKHPERLCAIEIAMGKFKGLGVKKGSPATKVPIKLGIHKNPNVAVGTSGTTQAQHDQVHIEMMMSAKNILETLGFSKFEWVPDNFRGKDSGWFSKCAEEKIRRCKFVK